jgi:hypothetical protein
VKCLRYRHLEIQACCEKAGLPADSLMAFFSRTYKLPKTNSGLTFARSDSTVVVAKVTEEHDERTGQQSRQ